MRTTTVRNEVEAALRAVASAVPGPWADGQRLREDLGLDSVDLVGLQVELEDRLGLRFDPHSTDLRDVFRSVGSLVAFLENCDGPRV